MFSPRSLLPSEVWVQVFGFLCAEDRLRVRAVCKDLRDLVDGSGLWKDWILKRRHCFCNKDFWKMLRRWRVTSVLLAQKSVLGWLNISKGLPGLTTVIIDCFNQTALLTLHRFSNLKHLTLRRLGSWSLDQLFPILPSQLEHLSVCDLTCYYLGSYDCLCDSATHLTNLRSLVCHCLSTVNTEVLLHSILSAFPRLTHLSLLNFDPLLEFPIPHSPLQHDSLSSLTIIVGLLPFPTKIVLPSLRSLGLFVIDDSFEVYSWLENLPTLSSLLVAGGPPVDEFVQYIPSSVTHLTLGPREISPAEMRALSSQLPNLHHLHLEPKGLLGPCTELIPQLFPRLHSLWIKHAEVPDEAFLSLAALTELQLLETQDPLPEELASKLRQLTQSPGLRICRRPDSGIWALWQRQLKTCTLNCKTFLWYAWGTNLVTDHFSKH